MKEPIPDYGQLMPLEEFRQACIDGFFIDYDGYGELCTETEALGEYISPSEVLANRTIPIESTQVNWYNK